MEKVIQYKKGRKFVIEIGQYSIMRIVLSAKEYTALENHFKQLTKG